MASFISLPYELTEMILCWLVPWNWNQPWPVDLNTSPSKIVLLKLVSRKFRDIISKELFRKANKRQFLIDMHRMNIDAITSMFVAKVNLGRHHETVPMISASISMFSLWIWKAQQHEKEEPETYFRVACSAMVAHNGIPWAQQKLQEELCLIGGPPRQYIPRLSPADSGDAWVRLKKNGCFSVSAYLGDLSILRGFLRDGEDPNEKHSLFGCPLYAAACAGETGAMNLLMDSGASFSEAGGAWGLPIEAAAQQGHLPAVQLLLDRGADPGFCLGDAIAARQETVVSWLLSDPRIDINASRSADLTPIVQAINRRIWWLIVRLCEMPALQPNILNSANFSPLCSAIIRGDTQVVRQLLSHPSIDVNKPAYGSRTPLHLASRNGFDDIARMLMERSEMDINAVNDHGRTALGSAILAGHHDTACLILATPGIDASIGPSNHTPLDAAMENRATSLVDLISARPEVVALMKAREVQQAEEEAANEDFVPTQEELVAIESMPE